MLRLTVQFIRVMFLIVVGKAETVMLLVSQEHGVECYATTNTGELVDSCLELLDESMDIVASKENEL